MAVITLNTGREHNLKGMAAKWDVSVLKDVVPFFEDTDKGFTDCCYQNLVFADSTGIETQNDINSFIFKVNRTTDVVTYKLYKGGVFLADITGTTYGTIYPVNSILYYEDQKFLAGLTIEWAKVYAAHGAGVYFIRATVTPVSGTATVADTINYTLWLYSDEKADKSIRIESIMNGYMLRSGINYTGLQFVDMIRVRGFFGRFQPEIETTNDIFETLEGQKKVVKQRKVQRSDIYELETLPLPKCIMEKITDYHFFADTLMITDFNFNNYDYNLLKKRVYLHENFELIYTDTSRYAYLRAKVKEQIKDNQKLNNL
jgi:hypothetical protein